MIKQLKALAAMMFPRTAGWFFSIGNEGQTDYQREVGNGLDSNVIMTPILWIARVFPEARLCTRVVNDDGTVEIDKNHEMANLVRRPNKHYTGITLWLVTLISYLLDGNAYWAKIRGARGQVVELWYLPHWMVTPKGDENTFISHYEYKPGQGMIKIEPADIVHFRYGMDPRDTKSGFSLLRTVLCEVFSDGESANLVAALLKNRGVPGLVISPDKDVVIGAEDAQVMKDYVNSNFGGKNRGGTMVVGAATKVQQFGFSPAELDLSALRGISEERVCAVLGLPAAVVGFGAGLNQTKVGATMRESVKLAWTGCIGPVQRALAEDLTLQLLHEFDPEDHAEVYFDTSDVEALSADAVTLATSIKTAVDAGVMTRSEGRKKLGLDVKPSDDVFLVSSMVVEIPRGGEQDMPEPPPAPVASLPGAPKPALLPEPVKELKHLSQLQRRLMVARTASAKRHEKVFQKRATDFLHRFGAAAEHAFLRVVKAAPGETQMKDAADDELIIDTMFQDMGVPRYAAELRSIFGSQYVSIHHDNVGTMAGLGIAVDIPDSAQIDILQRGGARAGLVDLTDAAKARAFQTLQNGRAAGEGPYEIARRLRNDVPAGPYLEVATRADLIARTETRVAQTESSMMAYRTMEGVEQVMMIDSRLGSFDADCDEINGTVVSFEEADGLLADEHPNGTRDVVPVFAEEA